MDSQHQTTHPHLLARIWLEKNAVILDTETTGLGPKAEIVEVAIIDCNGVKWMDSLVRPVKPIAADATAIHGITDKMVARAPTWAELFPAFERLIRDQRLVIYNASYDLRLIKQTSSRYGLVTPWIKDLKADCAMLAYAEHYGDWDRARGKFRWQKLTAAAEQQNVTVQGKAHRALADCLLTLGIIKAMAGR